VGAAATGGGDAASKSKKTAIAPLTGHCRKEGRKEGRKKGKKEGRKEGRKIKLFLAT
jgi:hypothetical protein